MIARKSERGVCASAEDSSSTLISKELSVQLELDSNGAKTELDSNDSSCSFPIVGLVLFSDCDRRGRRHLGCGSLLSGFFFPLLVRFLSVLSASSGCFCLRFSCDFRLWVWLWVCSLVLLVLLYLGTGLTLFGRTSLTGLTGLSAHWSYSVWAHWSYWSYWSIGALVLLVLLVYRRTGLTGLTGLSTHWSYSVWAILFHRFTVQVSSPSSL